MGTHSIARMMAQELREGGAKVEVLLTPGRTTDGDGSKRRGDQGVDEIQQDQMTQTVLEAKAVPQ